MARITQHHSKRLLSLFPATPHEQYDLLDVVSKTLNARIHQHDSNFKIIHNTGVNWHIDDVSTGTPASLPVATWTSV